MRADDHSICPSLRPLSPKAQDTDGRRRWWHLDGSAHFRREFEALDKYPNLLRSAQRRRDRFKEILEVYKLYEAEKDRAWIACGGAAAEAAYKHTVEQESALRDRITLTPARTLDGVMFKARVLLWRYYDNVAQLEASVRGDRQGCEGETRDGNALLLDILRLGVTSAAPAVPA